MKKVLITGGLGFVGSNLAHKCVSEGYDVTLLSRSDKKMENIRGIEGKVNLSFKNIQDISREDVEEKDYIFHCASAVYNYSVNENPYLDTNVNCDGTIALLEVCRKYNTSAKIIYPSTFFVNGNIDNLPANPSSPCEPLGMYPATKLAAEHFCKIYSRVFDLDVTIARLTNLFGIREQRNNDKKAAFNRMIGTAIAGGTIKLYDNGDMKRDYIYSDDVSDALLTLADHGEKGRVYYVGRGEGVKFRDMVNIMIEEVGSGKTEAVPIPAGQKATGIGDYWCDNTPLRELGWEPKISIKEGIKRVVAEYRREDGKQ